MACFRPNVAFHDGIKENGKRNIVWRAPAGTQTMPLPCGKCVGCRLSYSKGWAIRCMQEASLYDKNCFVTLTFNNDHYPPDGNLELRTYQNFMKKLRKCHTEALESQYGDSWKRYFSPIRYYHCGEYGGKLGRPHFHALLFNWDFDDKVPHTIRNGYQFYSSQTLNRVWANGFALIGDVTYKSAAYVARYVLKKVTGEDSDEHYVNKRTGLLLNPEYTTMSRRPGIGAGWFKKFSGDVYPSDFMVVNGRRVKPPRFYDNLLDKENPDLLDAIKQKRLEQVNFKEGTFDRLRVREEVALAQVNVLKRGIDSRLED